MTAIAAAGIGSTALQRAVASAVSQQQALTDAMIRDAEWVAGITLDDEQRQRLSSGVNGVLRHRANFRSVKLDHATLPSLRFDPEIGDPAASIAALDRPDWLRTAGGQVTSEQPLDFDGDPSFLSIAALGRLLRNGELTSVQLTKHCLQRLQQFDESLKCVVTLTEDLALQQAAVADTELSAGRDRGPLHGIPWGAKDLIAVPGYPTTWGVPQFRDRILPDHATVAQKLDEAGAVLVAKLSLGALAMGDQWYGGTTRNPWNPEQGSSGSSAGSAAAVAAGLVPFAIGSETLGSIVSPSRRCGVTGLRPTFGRISRHGCMSLSWTMDKLGPIARSATDCGLVFDAVHGADVNDPTSVDRWFRWPATVDLSELRIGRIVDAPTGQADQVILDVLEEQGAEFVDVHLPRDLHEWSVSTMLDVEAASVFHDLLEAGDTTGWNSWPDIFRRMHFVSAVDYLRASRIRTMLMQKMAEVFDTVDLYVGGRDLGISNLTGHPTVVFPTMTSTTEHPQPVCGTLTGRLHDEATLLAVAFLVEQRCEINRRPSGDAIRSLRAGLPTTE
jgi:Asp-tRNA(Asn)/Glu-tRNA(Gln) amidotransferase A subunit family amidase